MAELLAKTVARSNERGGGTRIAMIGNGGGGKTTLARELASRLDLPRLHVDSVQYLAGLAVRDEAETAAILDDFAAGPAWVLDGFGSVESMRRRFERATRIVFVDFPLWRHLLWATRRQLVVRRRPRAELPPGCDEAGPLRTWRLWRILVRVHRERTPLFRAWFAEPELAAKVLCVRTPRELADVARTLEAQTRDG